MSNKIVATINSVAQNVTTTKKDGSTYPATVVNYTAYGKVVNKPIHSNIIGKDPVLAQKLAACQPGQVVCLQIDETIFKNIEDVLSADQGSTTPPVPTPGAPPYSPAGVAPKGASGPNLKDVARIARASGLLAAVKISKPGEAPEVVLDRADAFAAFILTPLKVDTKGESTDEPKQDDTTTTPTSSDFSF